MAVKLKKRKFSIEAYYLMAKAGIIKDDERVELLNGEIIEMSPVGTPHIGMVVWLTHFFAKKLPEDTLVIVQSPIFLDEYAEPEPDLTICRYHNHYYRNRKARPADILLLIEVSDSTLAKDREVKMPLYAEAGIQTYWIVNLIDRQVEVYSDPEGNKYKHTSILSEQEILKLSAFDLEISLKEMFG